MTSKAVLNDPTEPAAIDDVAAALAWHNGDAMATIATLIDDCRHLRQQLALAEGSMSAGFTRGWTPTPEREI